ncbi:MAG: O-antigen ligase family protein [Ketobacter sp.]|nr:MAG: O-antigen ligase domain-containing protein [Ketobacter sp.]
MKKSLLISPRGERTGAEMPLYHSIRNKFRQQTSVLAIGYPVTVFLLLAFNTNDHARDFFTVLLLVSMWFDRGLWKSVLAQLIRNPAVVAGLLLIAYVAFSAFWSQPPHDPTPAVQIRKGISVILFWAASGLYFYNDENAMKRLFWAMGLGILGNLLGAWQMGQDLFVMYGNRLTGYGILLNPNMLGPVTVILIAIGLHLNLTSVREKILTIAMLGVAITIVALTVSRSAISAMVATMLIWLLYTPVLGKSGKLIVVVAAISVVSVFAYSTDLIAVLTDRGSSYRLLIWEETLRYAQQHWLVGWGWINDFSQTVYRNSDELQARSGTIAHPHSLPISTFYYGGIIGLLIHIGALAMLAREALRSSLHSLTIGLLTIIFLLTLVDCYTVVTRRDYILVIFWIPSAIIIMSNLSGPGGQLKAARRKPST